MKNFTLPLTFALLSASLIHPYQVRGSHAMGMELTYSCTGGNTYQFTMNFYRDCSGITPAPSYTLNISSVTCGLTTSITLNQGGPAVEISAVCPSVPSTCSGGSNPGVEQYSFTGTVTLPGYCPDWVFSTTECCRNALTTNLVNASSYNLYVQSTLDNSDSLCNSSPVFTSLPVPYVCQNQLSNYNFGAVDPDGDSLVYTLINPLTAAGTPIPYNSPYTPTYPITTTTGQVDFDSTTGNLSFNPNALQVCVVTVLIEEYRNDSLIGSVMRDIQVLVLNCGGNLQPYLANGTIMNVSGGTLTDSNSVVVCVGSSLSFDVEFADADSTDTLSVYSNNAMVMASSLLDTSGINPVTAGFSWIPGTGSTGFYPFTITVEDNNCPITGKQTYSFDITVISGTYAGPDIFLCNPDTIQLQAVGGSWFQWVPSSGLSNDTVADPVAVVGSTITYTVFSDSSTGCQGNDQVTIFVGTNFSLSVSLSDSFVCAGESVILTATPVPAGSYTYSWQASPWLSNLTIANPVATPPDTTTFKVDVYSADGCQKTSSITVNVNDNPVTVNPSSSDDRICNGASAQLYANAVSIPPYTLEWIDSDSNTVGTSDTVAVSPDTTTTYVLNAYSGGCAATGSVTIEVMSLSAGNDLSICQGSSVQISTQYSGPSGGIIPSVCGPSPSCAGTGGINDYVVGSGIAVNTNTSWPAPYGNWYKNAKHQFLYTAAELNALGVNGGTITSLAFNVTQINGTTTYYSYTIRIGCSSLTSLTTWQSGLTTVFNPKTHNVTVGWNVHNFDAPYDWDGISNLIVEICYDNLSQPSYTYNSSSPFTTTTFTSCIYFNSDGTQACPYTAGQTTLFDRPNAQFTVCTDNFTPVYSWNPATGLDYPDSANPVASPSATTAYIVLLNNGLCMLSDTVTVNVFPGFTISSSTVSSSCGNSDGSATATVSGGNPPFSYLWDAAAGGQTGSTATGLAAGTYFISVTDGGGCTSSLPVSVSDMGAPTISIAGVINTSCSTNSDGQASVTASGGNPPYSYLWDAQAGSQTTTTATGLSAGFYSVTVTDNSNCASSTSATVNNGTGPSASTGSAVNVTCYGGNDGQITASPSGGTPPYSYVWSTTPLQSGTTATGLTAGSWSVTVSDNKSCTTAASGSITQPTAVSVTTSVSDATCNTNDGSITATATGGTPGYSYLWNDSASQTTSAATGLYAGTYNVTVTDSKGCTRTAGDTVNNLSAPLVSLTVSNSSSCSTNDGSAAANVTGGAPPYTYLWSAGGQTTSVATGLAVGTVTVSVTDGNGCMVINSAALSWQVIANATADMYTLCSEDTTLLHANVVANQCDLYNYSNIAFSPVSGSGIPVVLTDDQLSASLPVGFTFNFFCTDYTQFYISSNGFISFDPLAGNGCCSGQVLPDANSPNNLISFAWEDLNPSLGGTIEYFTTGSAPNRKLVVNFLNIQHYSGGFPVTTQLILYETTDKFEIHTTDMPTDGGQHTMGAENSDGSIAVAVAGRNSASWSASNEGIRFSPLQMSYSITWKDENNFTIGTTDDIAVSPDSASSYYLTVSDGACNLSDTVSISASPAVSPITSTVNAACGVADGQATVSVSGGTPPYTYQWDDPSSQTTSSATGLFAGVYNVTVSDNLACSSVAGAAVNNTGAPTVTISSYSDISCFGGSDGQISSSVTGGIPPYAYVWSNGSTLSVISGLAAGNYSLTVTDNISCIGTAIQTITQPPALTTSVGIVNASCGTGDGSATVAVMGGVSPYSYLWSDPGAQTTSAATGLFAGNYTVTVTDSKGCSITANAAINNPSAPTVAVSVTDVTACGANDGTATATPSGGTPPYSYLWSPGNFTTQTITGLAAGSYNVTVTDGGNCVTLGSATVTEPVSVNSFPYSEDFETFNSAPYNAGSPGTPIIPLANGWENDQADAGQDWAPRSTPTQSNLTGPDYDHTFGNDGNTAVGNYIFAEDNFDNDPVMLLTPCFDISGLQYPYVGFWYHSYNGSDTAQKSYLHIDVFASGSWDLDVMPVIVPSLADQWIYTEQSLTTYSGIIKIRFRADVSNGFPYNDVAIDDFTVSDSLITKSGSLSENPECVIYPNPVNSTAVIFINNITDFRNCMFKLIDPLGRVIMSMPLHGRKTILDKRELAPGIYFYGVNLDGNMILNGKITFNSDQK